MPTSRSALSGEAGLSLGHVHAHERGHSHTSALEAHVLGRVGGGEVRASVLLALVQGHDEGLSAHDL
jgi:hypothetical protein